MMENEDQKNSNQLSMMSNIKYNQFLSDLSNDNYLEKKNKALI